METPTWSVATTGSHLTCACALNPEEVVYGSTGPPLLSLTSCLGVIVHPSHLPLPWPLPYGPRAGAEKNVAIPFDSPAYRIGAFFPANYVTWAGDLLCSCPATADQVIHCIPVKRPLPASSNVSFPSLSYMPVLSSPGSPSTAKASRHSRQMTLGVWCRVKA